MMKIFLFIFALVSCSSGFFLGGGQGGLLGGLLGGSQQELPQSPPPPPPQRHLVKIISDEPRARQLVNLGGQSSLLNNGPSGLSHNQGVVGQAGVLNHGQGGVLNHGQSGVLNNGPVGLLNNGQAGLLHNGPVDLLNNGPPGLLNNGQAGLVNNGQAGLVNNGQTGLLNNGPSALNNIGPVTVIRVIHENAQLPGQINQNFGAPRVIRIIHENANSLGRSNVPLARNVPQLPALNNLHSLGPSVQAVGQISLGQGPLGPAQIAPLISSAPASLLNGGPIDQGYSYSAPSHHSAVNQGYSYNRGG